MSDTRSQRSLLFDKEEGVIYVYDSISDLLSAIEAPEVCDDQYYALSENGQTCNLSVIEGRFGSRKVSSTQGAFVDLGKALRSYLSCWVLWRRDEIDGLPVQVLVDIVELICLCIKSGKLGGLLKRRELAVNKFAGFSDYILDLK